jgi:hypothetical protein
MANRHPSTHSATSPSCLPTLLTRRFNTLGRRGPTTVEVADDCLPRGSDGVATPAGTGPEGVRRGGNPCGHGSRGGPTGWQPLQARVPRGSDGVATPASTGPEGVRRGGNPCGHGSRGGPTGWQPLRARVPRGSDGVATPASMAPEGVRRGGNPCKHGSRGGPTGWQPLQARVPRGSDGVATPASTSPEGVRRGGVPGSAVARCVRSTWFSSPHCSSPTANGYEVAVCVRSARVSFRPHDVPRRTPHPHAHVPRQACAASSAGGLAHGRGRPTGTTSFSSLGRRPERMHPRAVQASPRGTEERDWSNGWRAGRQAPTPLSEAPPPVVRSASPAPRTTHPPRSPEAPAAARAAPPRRRACRAPPPHCTARATSEARPATP